MIQPATPRRGELFSIAVFAIALRLAVFLIATIQGRISLAAYTAKGDTASYIDNAAAMCGERPVAGLSDYDSRVFPGYPALIAVVHRLGASLPVAALTVTWLSAAVAAMTAGKVFADARIGWAMTCLIPHYLINSSLGMSEAPLLAVTCMALLASQRKMPLIAGILFALAGMIRPMACFAFAGLLLQLLFRKQHRQTVVLFISTVCAFSFQAVVLQKWTGNALRGVHAYANHPDAYAGHLLAWPFQSLLATPAVDHASVWRIFYIWLHVFISLSACGWIAWQLIRRTAAASDPLAAAWLVGNTAFVLCIGSVWGFRHFPRFTIPAEPALFWTLRRLLPRSFRCWLIIAAACTAVAIIGVIQSP